MKRCQIVLLSIFLFSLFLSFAYSQPSEIRILHVNDFHGFAEPYKPFGSDEMLGRMSSGREWQRKSFPFLGQMFKVWIASSPMSSRNFEGLKLVSSAWSQRM